MTCASLDDKVLPKCGLLLQETTKLYRNMVYSYRKEFAPEEQILFYKS